VSRRPIDINGRPIPRKSRSKRQPAVRLERGVELRHYEIVVATLGAEGKYIYARRRFWLPDDRAAEDKERELRRGTPRNALAWTDAHRLPNHAANSSLV
jgi:hypothetical protein